MAHAGLYLSLIHISLTLACFDSEPLRRRHLQWVMLPLGLVISMSTVFVKQHSILDV